MAYKRKNPAGRSVRHKGFISITVGVSIFVISGIISLLSGYYLEVLSIGCFLAAIPFIIGVVLYAYDKHVI